MLKISKISFPGLGIGEFEVNSVAFEIFGISIAWYALIITCGMVLAVAYTIYRAKKIGVTFDDVIDMVIFAIPLGIVGARLYYVLTSLDSFDSFSEVIDIRSGGLAIYGGILAGAFAVLGVCLYKKINFFAFADCCTPGIILAQALGRWGNFMNGEAFGGKTDSFLRMGVDNDLVFRTFGEGGMVYVHPTFLYESLWNFVGFVLINIFYKHKKYDGQIFLMVFGWYGLGRMLIEGLRTDSLWIGPFGALSVIALLFVVAGIAVFLAFMQRFITLIKAKSYKGNVQYVSYAALGAVVLGCIFVILDVSLALTPALIPAQRVSQVLAALIFTVSAVIQVYLVFKRPNKPFYVKPVTEKKRS